MDEQVIQDLYKRARSKGYTKSIDDFKALLQTDQEVIQDSYKYAISKGYSKPIESFSELIGVGGNQVTDTITAEAAAPPAVPFGQGSSEPSDQQEQPSGSTTEVLDPTKPLYEQDTLGSETRQFTNPVLEDKVAKQKSIPKELFEQSMLPEDVVSKSDSLFNQEDLNTKINSIKLAEEQGTHKLFYHTEDLRPVAMDSDQVKGLITSKVIELYQSERVDKPDFNELKEDEKKVVLQSLFSEFVPGDAIEDYMESNGFERSSNQFIGLLKTSKSNFLKGVATMGSSSLASGEALSDYAYQGGQQSDVTALKNTVLAAKGGFLTKKEFEKKMEYLREDKKSAPTVLEYVNTREGQMAQPRPMTDAEKAEYDRLFSITYEQAQKEQVDIQQAPSTSVDEWAAKQKVDPEWMDNFVARDLFNAAGSMAAFAGFGLLSGGAAAPTMAFGGSVAFGSAYKEAMQSGSPDAGWAGIMASPSGIVDGLAATKFFKSVGKAVDGLSDKTLWRMATSGATEGLTETGQGIWENITAKTIYDETREILTEETLREGAAGAVLGSLGVGGGAALRLSAEKMAKSSNETISKYGKSVIDWMDKAQDKLPSDTEIEKKADLKGDGGPDSVDIYANEALNDQEAKRVRELQNILKDEGGVLAEEEKETLQAELDGYLERVKNTQKPTADVTDTEQERTDDVQTQSKDKGTDTELQEVKETGEPEVQDTKGDRPAEGQSQGIVDKTLKAVIAPFRKTQVKDSKEASAATGTKEYTEHKSRLQSVAKELGIEGELTMQDNMGGFASQEGNGVVKEVSTTVYFPDGTTKEQADEFAAIMGSMTVEAQEATISSQEVATGQEANSIEYSVETKDPDALVAALEAEGITDYSVDLATGTVTFLDLDLDKETKESKQKTIETLERVAEAAGIEADWMGVFTNSTYIDGERKTEILEKIKSKNGRASSGKNVGALSEEAARIEKDRSERARAKELGTTITKLIKEIREYVSENWKMFQDNNKFLEKLEFEPLLENTENPTTLNKNVGILSKALLGTRLPKQLQDLFGDKISEARKMIKEYAEVQKVGKKKANADFFFKMLKVAERREKKGISGAKEKALRDLAATFASVVESMEDAGVTVVTDLKAYKDATGKDGQSSTRQGIFVSKEGTIYLNVEELADGWGKTVIFHEATHPIINIIKNTDKKLYGQVIAGIQSLKKDPALKKQIEAIEAQVAKSDVYKSKAERADEVLVEFIALVASGDVALPEGRKGLMKVFEDFMIKIAKMLGLDYKSDRSLINLASMISETLKSGSSIESIVGKGNVTKENMTAKNQSSAIDRTGQQNEEFFTGKAKEKSSQVPYKPVVKIDQNTPVAKAYDLYSAGGNFTGHISKMIAGFQEKQIKVAEAIVKGGFKRFLDIGASEGGLVKTVASQSPDMRAIALDPNSQMKSNFDSTPKVKNAKFVQEAYQGSWTEADGTKINEYKPKTKFDVINEDFAFQFINNNRADQVKGVKEMMSKDGVFITSEKFINTKNYKANEEKKYDHQSKYFNEAELTKDKQEIVTGMAQDMVNDKDYESVLFDNFSFVEEFWNSGNFKGYVASDSKSVLDSFKNNVGDLTTEFTDKDSPLLDKGQSSAIDRGEKGEMTLLQASEKTRSQTKLGKIQDSAQITLSEKGKPTKAYSGKVSLEAVRAHRPGMYVGKAIGFSKTHLVGKPIRKYSSASNKEQKIKWADKVYEQAKKGAVSNILYIYDNIDPDIRAISRLWYDGANIISQKKADKYKLTLEQVSAVIATQSPQKPWNDNVHLAHFILDFVTNDSETLYSKEDFEYFKSKSEGYPAQKKLLPLLKGSIGTPFSGLGMYAKATMIRAKFDQSGKRKAPLRLPTGALTGNNASSLSSFSGYATIVKALSVIQDGSKENISANLGKANKVRSFYNNIATPTTPGEVTIDTHAIAAAYLLPLGSSSTEVSFDEATYAFFAEAYREAAEARGILAREMQSITWEGARAIFPQNKKSNKAKKAIRSTWDKYVSGEITEKQAQDEIRKNGDDLSNTDWSKHIDQLTEGGENTSYLAELSGDSWDTNASRQRDASRDSGRIPKLEKSSRKTKSKGESQASAIDRDSVVYHAAMVDDQAALKKKFPPVHPNEFYHHSTMEFKPKETDDIRLGEKSEMKVTGRLTTDKVDVILVDNPRSKNADPHITLSTAEGVKPFESNKEIEANRDQIKPVKDFSISVTEGYFDGKSDVKTTQSSAIDRGEKRLAPNGKPSNLNETQYNQVRTPEFKRWFGDWDWNSTKTGYDSTPDAKMGVPSDPNRNADKNFYDEKYKHVLDVEYSADGGKTWESDQIKGLNKPHAIERAKREWGDKGTGMLLRDPNSSKVVDENGEPLVVYHGSPSTDIDVFDRTKGQREDSGLKEFGSYFSTNTALAEMYAGASKSESVMKFIDSKIADLKKTQEKVRSNEDFNSIDEAISHLEEQKKKQGRVYPVFLNLRKMETFDGDAEVNIDAWRNLEVNVGYKWATGRDAMEALAGKNRMAARLKVDGVKAENIIEMSIGTLSPPRVYKETQVYKDAKEKYLGDAFLVFDGQPENIKLADGTNTTFDPNDNRIQFSAIDRGEKRLAPNGKPSNLNETQYNQVRTPEFKRWFGDWENDPENASKVVDENGEPLVVYHGGPKIEDGVFKRGYVDEQGRGDKGIYFTDDKNFALYFADQTEQVERGKKNEWEDLTDEEWDKLDENNEPIPEENLMFSSINPSFLNLRTPVVTENGNANVIPRLYEDGKDGLIAVSTSDFGFNAAQYVVFEPTQIKLADGSNTTFDPNDNRIQFSAIDRGQKNSRISERMNAISSQFKNTKYNAVQQDMVAELAAEALDEMGEIAGFEYARDQLTGEGELALRADMMMRAIARLTDKQLEGKATATEKRKIAEMHALFSLDNTEKGGALAQLNKVYTDYPLLKRWNEIYRVTEGFREGMEKRYSPDSETDTRTNEEVIKETEEALRKEFETTLRNEVEKAVREALNKRDSGTTSTKSTNDQKKKAARARIKKEVDNLKGLLRKLGGTANMGLPIEDTANILSAMTRVVRAYINAGIVNASAIISELRSEIGDTMTDQDLKDTVNYIINKEKLSPMLKEDVNTLKEEFYKVLKDNETISKEDVRRIAAMVGMNPDYVRMAAENAQADYDLTISTDPVSRPRTKGPKDAAREKKARARRAADTVTESVSIKAAIDQVMDDIRDGVTPDTKAIAKNIVDTMNLSPRLAIKIAEQIEKKLNERIDKVLETTLKVEPRPDEGTIKRRQEQSKLINKVRRAIASGALSNGEGVIDAFQEKFGLEPIAARDAVLLETLSDEIAKLEKEARDNPGSLKREQLAHLYKEMNGAIDRIKKKNPAWYGRWFMSIGVKNTLSGPNTPKNAGLGGLMQLSWMNTMVTLSELVKGGRIPSNAVRILKSGIKALKMVPSAFSGAVQAMKSGVAAHSSMDTIFEGALQDYETRSERAFSAGFKEAWKQTRSKEDVWALGRYTYEVITIGTRLLVAMDAFMAPVSAEYVSELNERAKRSTAQNPSLQLPEISDFKDQAKRDLENVRRSIRSIASKLNPIDSSMNQSQVKAVLKAREKEVSIREKKMGVATSDEGSYIRRRSTELYQNSKKESFIEALGLVKEYLLLGEPRGIGGFATSGIQKNISIKDSDGWGAVALKVPLGLSFLFMRMLGNMINMTIEGSLFAPITNTLSFKKGVDGGWGVTSAMKENPMRARTKWMSSLVTYGTMLYLFGQVFKIGDEDDGEDEGKIMLNPDRKYDFYGAGDKDKGQIGGRPRMQVVNRETGEAYEIKYLPNTMPALAAIGIMQDIVAQRGRSEEDGATKAKKDFEDRSTADNITLAAAEGFWKSLGEGSFNSINRIQMSWSKGANASESFVSVLTDITLGSLNKGISPAIIRDTKLQIETLINEVEGEGNIEKAPDYLTPSRDGFGDVFVNTLLRGTLLEDSFTEAGLGGREKLDAIGNPVQETPPSMRLLGRRVYDSKELSELAEKYGPELVLKNYKLTTNKDVRNNNKKQDGLIRFADTEEGRDDMIQFEIAVKKKAWEITKPQIKDEFSRSLEDYKKEKEEAIESMDRLPEEITVMGITATPRKDAIESVKKQYPELTEEQWMARQGDALSERWKENLKKAQSDLVKEITDKAAAEGYKPRDKRAGTKLIAF